MSDSFHAGVDMGTHSRDMYVKFRVVGPRVGHGPSNSWLLSGICFIATRCDSTTISGVWTAVKPRFEDNNNTDRVVWPSSGILSIHP